MNENRWGPQRWVPALALLLGALPTQAIAQPKEKAALKGRTGDVISVAFSSDGKLLASGSWDKTIELWNVQAGK